MTRPGVPFVLVVVLIDVMGFGLIIPVLPALVGEFTASRDSLSYWYGALAAAYGVMQFFAAPMLGALSDRYGRRPVLLISIFGLGIDFIVQALASSIWVLLAARLIGGATAASFSVANAYIADVTSPEERSKSFGMLGAVFGIGFIVGPMLGGLLGEADIRLPFFAAAGLSLLNWLYGYFVLPESLPKARRVPFRWRAANPFSALAGLAQMKSVGPLVAVFALTNLAQFILHSTWVLYTETRFGWTPRDNGIALFAVGVATAVMQAVLLGTLLKRFGEANTALAGLAMGAIGFVLYGLATQGWMMYAIILGTLLSGAAGPAMQGIVSKAVDATQQGITMGALTGLASVMQIVAPLLGTIVFAQVTHLPSGDWRIGSTFFLSAALQTASLVLAWRVLRR
jgi:MFS transporter, DHA1 family, tetracycline resistance protein